jgi:hypothetical protein
MSKNAFRWYAKEKAWMTITLELPPETEMSLLAQAEARGLTLDAYLQTVIANQAAATESVKVLQNPLAEEDSGRAIDELFDIVQVPPGVGKGVMRRENWYR